MLGTGCGAPPHINCENIKSQSNKQGAKALFVRSILELIGRNSSTHNSISQRLSEAAFKSPETPLEKIEDKTEDEMVKLCVYISMELEGVTNIRPSTDDQEYFFTVQCSSCREVHPKTVSFNQKNEREISGSKGSANFVWRCTNCKKEHSASFLPSDPSPKSKSRSLTPIAYTSQSSEFQPLITLDCRGLEFTKFHFGGVWLADADAGDGEGGGSKKGQSFEIDWEALAKEGEERWDDYDESSEMAVSVSELKSEIRRV